MIPNMSDTIIGFEQGFIYVQIVVLDDGGFEDTLDPVETITKGVIQIPKDEVLTAAELDLSVNYRQVHLRSDLKIRPRIDDEIKYIGKDFKIVSLKDYEEYGYFEFIVAEVKNGSN